MFEGSRQSEIRREEEIDLRDYLRVLKKRRWVMLGFFLITFVAALLFTVFQTPLYLATTQLVIEKSNPVSLMTPYGYKHDPFFLNTQFELIKSKSVLYRVIDNLKLTTEYRDYFLRDENPGILSTMKSFVATSIKTVLGKNETEQSDDSSEQKGGLSDADKVARQMVEAIQVQPIRETNVIKVTYKHKEPRVAQMVVTEIASSYMQELLDINVRNSNQAVEWMTGKAEEEKKKLEQAETALQDYSRKHDLITIEDRLAVIPQQITDYGNQLVKARASRKELEEVYDQVKKLKQNYKAIESLSLFNDNKDLQQVRDKILQAEQQQKELSKKYGVKHPAMIKITEEQKLLQAEKKSTIDRFVASLKNEYDLAVKNEANLEQLLDESKKKLLDMNEKLIQHNILKREVDSNRLLYEALLTQIKETTATEKTQTVNVFIAEKAVVPEKPAEPKKGRNMALAVIFGLFGAITLAFFLEYLDNTVRTVKQIEGRYGLQVLGVVQLLKDHKALFNEVEQVSQKLSLLESYRMIRSAIMLSSPEHPPKSLLVTSGMPSQGKSTTCFNLAEIIALEGKSVLMIDCDMRCPALHKMINVNNDKGLSTYLTGMVGDGIIIYPDDSKVRIIPAGPVPPNPTELLGSPRMKKLLEEVSGQFDYILLDTPPILSFADAQVLGAMVDAAVLVFWSGQTTYEEVEAVLNKVSRARLQVIGAILNGKDMKKDGEGISYDYYSGCYAGLHRKR